MTTTELLEQVRAKLDGASDYRIAQVLEIPRQKLSAMKQGKERADNYTCAKIAEQLGRDPLEIIARVEAQTARTAKKREYWQSFFSGLKATRAAGSSQAGPTGLNAPSSHRTRPRNPGLSRPAWTALHHAKANPACQKNGSRHDRKGHGNTQGPVRACPA
jgi:hypothetical protein